MLAMRLRAYMHAYLGDAEVADEALRQILQQMLATSGVLQPVAAFCLAQRAIVALPVARTSADPFQQALLTLPAQARAIILLRQVQPFADADLGQILGLLPSEVRAGEVWAWAALGECLVPPGGTALVVDADGLTALDLASTVVDLGFVAIREPNPGLATIAGRAGPILILTEVIRPDGTSHAPTIARLVHAHDAIVVGITAQRNTAAFLALVPTAHMLRKPFETATVIRAVLDAIAAHSARRIRMARMRKDQAPA